MTARRVAGQGAGWEHAGADLEENKALVRRYYQEVLTGRDRDLLARLLDPAFVSHVSGRPAAGAGAYTAAVDATHAAFPDLVVTVHDQVAEQDQVVTRWSATGTHAGDFAGVPATGRRVTVTGIHIHRVRRRRVLPGRAAALTGCLDRRMTGEREAPRVVRASRAIAAGSARSAANEEVHPKRGNA